MQDYQAAQRREKLKVLALGAAGLAVLIVGLGLAFMLWVWQPAALANASARPADFVPAAPAAVTFPAPELQLKDLADVQHSLEDYRGQVVLVNNWAYWCGPCQAELPELQTYYQAHQGQGFVLVGIESGSPYEYVEDSVQKYGLTYPVWLDPKASALEKFHNGSLPSSYVIGPDGSVILAWAGPIKRATLEQYVTPLLEK
jgi:cytochrome c biogenesis protein CcmG, thiol:disulfide interchange protein DsbE